MERRGGVILLDRRYGSARITKTLPEWISNRLQHHNRFGSPFAFIRVVAYPSCEHLAILLLLERTSWEETST